MTVYWKLCLSYGATICQLCHTCFRNHHSPSWGWKSNFPGPVLHPHAHPPVKPPLKMLTKVWLAIRYADNSLACMRTDSTIVVKLFKCVHTTFMVQNVCVYFQVVIYRGGKMTWVQYMCIDVTERTWESLINIPFNALFHCFSFAILLSISIIVVCYLLLSLFYARK